jgi:hypothetical protein
MNLERLIESIGLSSKELRSYLIREIDEFLSAPTLDTQEEEFADILFALKAFSFAHSKKHYDFETWSYTDKICCRLRTYGTLSKKEPRLLQSSISEIAFGVVHFAFGSFTGQWELKDAFKNGTVAEITLLTDNPFQREGEFTNHLIITFDDVEQIEFKLICSGPDVSCHNTVLCKLPDFMFATAKATLRFEDLEVLMSLQVIAALNRVTFSQGAIAHLHSWECGFLMKSEEFIEKLKPFNTIFSPYLTVGRLLEFIKNNDDSFYTISVSLGEIASQYEKSIMSHCKRVVVESRRDACFYRSWGYHDKIKVISYAPRPYEFSSCAMSNVITFVAGGRPVREKGFIELCDRIAELLPWAREREMSISLRLVCRDPKRQKGAKYIQALEEKIREQGLSDIVSIEDRVSIVALKSIIRQSSALIVPSLYDPFCLMPKYAMEENRICFVSCNAGISENFVSHEFIFDPLKENDLVRAVRAWHEQNIPFSFRTAHPSYRTLYVD